MNGGTILFFFTKTLLLTAIDKRFIIFLILSLHIHYALTSNFHQHDTKTPTHIHDINRSTCLICIALIITKLIDMCVWLSYKILMSESLVLLL